VVRKGVHIDLDAHSRSVEACASVASLELTAGSLSSFSGGGRNRLRRYETDSLSATIYRFVSELKQAKRYFVSGIVQGVGFRYYTQHAAQRLHLSGYAKNLPDGRVEVYAIGTGEQLAKLRSVLARGPWGASVSEVGEEGASIDSQYTTRFVITY
jgi:acylphosphatase